MNYRMCTCWHLWSSGVGGRTKSVCCSIIIAFHRSYMCCHGTGHNIHRILTALLLKFAGVQSFYRLRSWWSSHLSVVDKVPHKRTHKHAQSLVYPVKKTITGTARPVRFAAWQCTTPSANPWRNWGMTSRRAEKAKLQGSWDTWSRNYKWQKRCSNTRIHKNL